MIKNFTVKEKRKRDLKLKCRNGPEKGEGDRIQVLGWILDARTQKCVLERDRSYINSRTLELGGKLNSKLLESSFK